MKRSYELKQTLSEDVSRIVQEKHVPSDDQVKVNARLRIGKNHWDREDWNAYHAEVKKIQEENQKLIAILEILMQKTDALSSNLYSLSDEEYNQRYHEIECLLQDYGQIERYGYKERFTLSFVDISSIENFEQYIKGRWPMQFIPHKEEVGRILALAKNAHSKRTGRDETTASSPIRIVDIGGSNGALGKLVVDLARENDLEIEYITVDPDVATIQAATDFYRDENSLKFIPLTAEEYVANLYVNNPEIKALIDFRRNRIQEGERKIKELKIYLAKIHSDYFKLKEPLEQREAIENHCRILRDDFGIEINPASFLTYEDFDEIFEEEYIWEQDEVIGHIFYEEKYRNAVLQPEIDGITKQINARLAQIPPATDLTINSWMPPRVDLTADIQFVNSAAIFYCLEFYGATGCRSNIAFPEKPTRPGDGESYRQGDNYRSVCGWKSHSVPQLRLMSDRRGKDVPFTERIIDCEQNPRGVELTFPFSNAFVVQTRKDVGIDNVEPGRAGIEMGGCYPWEQELNERGGAMQPIRPITDKDGIPDLKTLKK